MEGTPERVSFVDGSGKWQCVEKAYTKKEFYVSLWLIDYRLESRSAPLAALPPDEDEWKKVRIIYDMMRHNRQALLKELAMVMMDEGILISQAGKDGGHESY